MSIAADSDVMTCNNCESSLKDHCDFQIPMRGVDGQERFFRVACCGGAGNKGRNGCGHPQYIGESRSTPFKGATVIVGEIPYQLIQQLSGELVAMTAEVMEECSMCVVAPTSDSVPTPA